MVEAELPERSPLTVAQEEELDRRLAAYREDRQPGEPWREALAKIDREELVRRHRQGYERHPVKPGEFDS